MQAVRIGAVGDAGDIGTREREGAARTEPRTSHAAVTNPEESSRWLSAVRNGWHLKCERD